MSSDETRRLPTIRLKAIGFWLGRVSSGSEGGWLSPPWPRRRDIEQPRPSSHRTWTFRHEELPKEDLRSRRLSGDRYYVTLVAFIF